MKLIMSKVEETNLNNYLDSCKIPFAIEDVILSASTQVQADQLCHEYTGEGGFMNMHPFHQWIPDEEARPSPVDRFQTGVI